MEQTVIDGVTYYDADAEMSYDEAVKWAEENNVRLLRRGEWCELWDASEDFRKSCAGKHWWTASVYSSNRSGAWFFNGEYGYLYTHLSTYSVRCVMAERVELLKLSEEMEAF